MENGGQYVSRERTQLLGIPEVLNKCVPSWKSPEIQGETEEEKGYEEEIGSM
jgi:hypothetical protein